MRIFLVLVYIFCFSIISEAKAVDLGLNNIEKRQFVACGTNREFPNLAYKENKELTGFDVTICKALSYAVFGDENRIKIISVKKENIGEALNSGKIDIMLGNTSLSSSEESKFYVTPVDVLYYDKQIFASRIEKQASSMKDFEYNKVCVLKNSPYEIYLSDYNQKFALGFKIIKFNNLEDLKRAFYLKSCDLISGSELYVKKIVADLNSKDKAQILPEEVIYLPVKAYSAGVSPSLNIAERWIINALKLADINDITAENISTFKASRSQSIKNLLGYDDRAWKNLHLNPDWVQKFVARYGNYSQILEKSFGSKGMVNVDMQQNKLIGKGGFISYQPFF